ncbi:MAG: DUF1499 domain-containing protein [Verrucomicrobiota bacterium]
MKDDIDGLVSVPPVTKRMSPTGKIILYIIVLVCIAGTITTVTTWQSRNKGDLHWEDTTQLPEVKAAPPMVSSEAPESSEAYIAPFICRGKADYALTKLLELLERNPQYLRIRVTDGQIQAVAETSLLKYQDDVIFQARSNPERIEVFSSSRVGINDFGSNRDRIEEIREILLQWQVLK